MKKLLLLLCILTPLLLTAQENNWTIKSIEFEGLKKTNPKYLRQFLKSKEGSAFTKKGLENDIQQLWNAGTNQDVQVKIDSLSNQQVKLTFQLKEKKTLIPIVNFGGIDDNIWFQLGLTDFNWRGRGHQFLAFYQNNDMRHSGQVFYRIPYLNRKWGVAFDVLQWRSLEPLFFPEGTVQYNYDNFNVGATAIRNFNFKQRLELGASFFVEKYSKAEIQNIDNPPGPDGLQLPKTASKVEYIHNYINHNRFYLQGWDARGIWQVVYNLEDQTFFNSLILQARKFHRFGKRGNFALRARMGISTNNDTPFAPFVIDSRINLRGSGNRIERGTAQLILNMEYRHTLLDSDNWAIQGVAFSDMGNWRPPGGTLNQFLETDELRQFVGGGFRVIYKRIYNAIFRIDYGIDIYNQDQHGIVLGIGQYF